MSKRSPRTTFVHKREEGTEHRRKKRELTAQQIHSRHGGVEWDSLVGVLCQECLHMLELEVLKDLFLSFHSTGTVQTSLRQTANRHTQLLSCHQCAFFVLCGSYCHTCRQTSGNSAKQGQQQSFTNGLFVCVHSFCTGRGNLLAMPQRLE